MMLLLAACGPSTPTPATEPVEPVIANTQTAPAAAEPVALAILVEAHGLWIGNDSYAYEPEAAYPGVYRELVPALDGLRGVGPAGSRIATVTYGRGAVVRAELGDADAFDGSMIGSQKEVSDGEPYGHVQRDLVLGIETAHALLAGAEGRRVLVLLTDGADTNLDDGPRMLGALAGQLQADRVEVHAVYYASELDGDLQALEALTPNIHKLSSKDGFAAAVRAIAEAIGD